jgi:CO/xanthine dehydrogenase FAD-binding subunit
MHGFPGPAARWNTHVMRPTTLSEAVEARAERPELWPVAGGTDLMVDVNFGRTELAGVLDLTAVAEMMGIDRDDQWIRIGAAHPMADIADRLADVTALAGAVVTVGSPQIRSRATLGGNMATASPAGDSLPALLVHDAEVEVASATGSRRTTLEDLLVSPGQTTLGADELIVSVHLPRTAWRSRFAKVGTRNAMVIATCSVAVAVNTDTGAGRIAAGAVAPTARRLPQAEAVLEGLAAASAAPARAALDDLEDAVRADIAPIDDHRSTAAYRTHATSTLVRRLVQRVLTA